MSASFNPYTKRQSMIEPDYEVYRYRSTYMNEPSFHFFQQSTISH